MGRPTKYFSYHLYDPKKIKSVKLQWVEWQVPLYLGSGEVATYLLMKAVDAIKHVREGRNWNERPAWKLAILLTGFAPSQGNFF